MANTDDILKRVNENYEAVRDIKDNHLMSIYKSLGQIRGTLVILVPLVLAILTLVVIGMSNGE